MPPTKKKSPLEDTNNQQQSTSQSTSKELDINHSSWLYRLTASNTQLDSNQEEKDRGSKEETVQQEIIIEPPHQTQTNGSGGGLWLWLGYPMEKQVPLEDMETDMNHQQAVGNPNGFLSYWKSFFTSSKASLDEPLSDSVIIDEEKPMEEKQQQINAQNASIDDRKPVVAPCRNNAVVPTFDSQFNLSIPSKNCSLLSKAINGIYSIFTTQSSATSSLIDEMKRHPETIADKKIVIIGVHGWFPMKLVRSMIGEPTGTSTKFCEQMSVAVKKYFETTHQLVIPDEAITSIALQWEGKVLERVEKLYELVMTDWKQTIMEANIILWVTHSQGTPVSTILLRKLIEQGLIQTQRQPVCMLAMAGISHGPFPGLKGNILVKYFEADAARELFEFTDSSSPISTQYREAMAFNLQQQVKTVLIGSMQDQVVPLYSAIMSGLSHPNILRAIYIDGHMYSKNDFLIRLITFAIRLLNFGLSDHGFLIHISAVLAGNMYTLEGGHSTVYEELDVFMLPLQYLFETPPLGTHHPIVVTKTADKVLHQVKARLDPFQAKLRLNPFHLPWAMRGIWDDHRILENETLRGELDILQELFDNWHPTSGKLKEIKFRLEPLKARL